MTFIDEPATQAELSLQRLTAGQWSADPAARWFTYEDGSVMVREKDGNRFFPLTSEVLKCGQCGRLRKIAHCDAPILEQENFDGEGKPLITFNHKPHGQRDYFQVIVSDGIAMCGRCFYEGEDEDEDQPRLVCACHRWTVGGAMYTAEHPEGAPAPVIINA